LENKFANEFPEIGLGTLFMFIAELGLDDPDNIIGLPTGLLSVTFPFAPRLFECEILALPTTNPLGEKTTIRVDETIIAAIKITAYFHFTTKELFFKILIFLTLKVSYFAKPHLRIA
jgi:hypothetical protein